MPQLVIVGLTSRTTEHTFEKYLTFLPPRLLQKLICFRLCNDILPIETGSWRRIAHNLRKCNLCYLNLIGDEFYYLLECLFFNDERKTFLPVINRRNLNCITFSNIMNEERSVKLKHLCLFLS